VTARGGEIVGEQCFPLDHDYESVVAGIMATGADVVFNTIVPLGLTPFFAQHHDAGFIARDGQVVCTCFDENFFNLVPTEHVEGLLGCPGSGARCSTDPARPGQVRARSVRE